MDTTTKFDKEQQSVLSTLIGMAQAMEEKDIDKVMNVYEEESMVLFEPSTPVTDLKTIQSKFEEIIAADIQVNFGEHSVYVVGDIAVHLAHWSIDGTSPDGSKVQDQGLTVGVLRKQSDGRWLLVYDNPYGQHVAGQPVAGLGG